MSSLPLSQPLYLNGGLRSKTPRSFHCILIGVGGTGGYVLQALTRLLYGMEPNGSRIAVTLIDGDRVEQHNLKRQHFLDQDIGRNKATVLAERFGSLYHLPLHAIPHYLEQAQTLTDLCDKVLPTTSIFNAFQSGPVPILVGCVDNHITRRIISDAYHQLPIGISIDVGNDAADPNIPAPGGYGGHCVVGVRSASQSVLPDVTEVYPEIMTDTSIPHPAQACGLDLVHHPQHFLANLWAAMMVLSVLTDILTERVIRTHAVNFNALTMTARPQLAMLSHS